MKVLILSSKLPYPPKDGGAIATLSLAEGLADNGINVTMLSFNTKKHFFPLSDIPLKLSKKIRFISSDIDTSTSPVKAVINLLFSRKPYVSQRFQTKDFTQKLRQLLGTETFDVIQLEGPYFAHYLPLIKKQSEANISLRAHNIEHEIWERRYKNEKRFLIKMYLKNLTGRIRNLELNLLGEIDLLIPISKRDEDRFLTMHSGLMSFTIPTGIDLSAYTLEEENHVKDIFFIGALDWMPNQEGLRWFINRGLPLLEKQSLDALTFHIAGRNAPKAFVESLASCPQIIYHGEVDDARTFMKEHGIMLVPLFTGSGIRIKILEGMALGKCIITTSIGAEGIPAENEKHILITDNEEIFVRHIKELTENPDRALAISREARNLIQEKFDTFAIASKLGDFYKKLA